MTASRIVKSVYRGHFLCSASRCVWRLQAKGLRESAFTAHHAGDFVKHAVAENVIAWVLHFNKLVRRLDKNFDVVQAEAPLVVERNVMGVGVCQCPRTPARQRRKLDTMPIILVIAGCSH